MAWPVCSLLELGPCLDGDRCLSLLSGAAMALTQTLIGLINLLAFAQLWGPFRLRSRSASGREMVALVDEWEAMREKVA